MQLRTIFFISPNLEEVSYCIFFNLIYFFVSHPFVNRNNFHFFIPVPTHLKYASLAEQTS